MLKVTSQQHQHFEEKGYLIVPGLLDGKELPYYQSLYEDFIHNRVDASRYRSDLGGHVEEKKETPTERITQIMVPSRVLPELLKLSLHENTLSIARQLLGDDMTLDFDMLIEVFINFEVGRNVSSYSMNEENTCLAKW